MYTLLCAFEDRQHALQAITRMIRGGLPRDDIHVQPEPAFYMAVEEAEADGSELSGMLERLWHFIGRATRSGKLPGAQGTYRDAVRKGSTVVVIHVARAEEALEAATRISDLGAFDVEHCRSRWEMNERNS